MVNLENLYLYTEDIDEYPVSSEEVVEAIRQRKNDEKYKTQMRNALINSVKQKKLYLVRQILDSMYMTQVSQENTILFIRELVKDGTTVESQVDRFLKQYEISYSFCPYIK